MLKHLSYAEGGVVYNLNYDSDDYPILSESCKEVSLSMIDPMPLVDGVEVYDHEQQYGESRVDNTYTSFENFDTYKNYATCTYRSSL